MSLRILKTGFFLNIASIISFAVSMPLEFDFGNYLFSILIALSYLIIVCVFNYTAENDNKLAGNIALSLCIVYVVLVLTVYYAQLTTVRFNELSQISSRLLDFKKFGLMFNYDLLGYSMMSLSAFFIGLTINCDTKAHKVLKILLLFNIVFFVSCFITPLLNLCNLSSADGGIPILEFWCAFFCPISILSYGYLKQRLKGNYSI